MGRIAWGVGRELWDEIVEIEHDPDARGTPYDDSDPDPEFEGLRIDIAVPGYAIFYLVGPDKSHIYVASIREWDYPDAGPPRVQGPSRI